jgi:hypothetical protein
MAQGRLECHVLNPRDNISGCTAMDDTRFVLFDERARVVSVANIRDPRGNLLFAVGMPLPVFKHIHVQDTLCRGLETVHWMEKNSFLALTSRGPFPRPPCAMIAVNNYEGCSVGMLNLDTEEVTLLRHACFRRVLCMDTKASTAAVSCFIFGGYAKIYIFKDIGVDRARWVLTSAIDFKSEVIALSLDGAELAYLCSSGYYRQRLISILNIGTEGRKQCQKQTITTHIIFALKATARGWACLLLCFPTEVVYLDNGMLRLPANPYLCPQPVLENNIGFQPPSDFHLTSAGTLVLVSDQGKIQNFVVFSSALEMSIERVAWMCGVVRGILLRKTKTVRKSNYRRRL